MFSLGGRMRRVRAALILTVLFGLIRPAPAHAWWDWLDELSGPGKFKGWHLEARLVCFTERVSTPNQTPNQTATPTPIPGNAAPATTTANASQGDFVDQNFSGGVTFSACSVRP